MKNNGPFKAYVLVYNLLFEPLYNQNPSIHPRLKLIEKPKTFFVLSCQVFHKIEKNFFCDFCGPAKGFAEKYQLRRHMLIHRQKLEKMAAAKEEKMKEEFSFEPEVPWTWSDNEFEDELPHIPKVELQVGASRWRSSPIEQVMVKEELISDSESFSMTFSPENEDEVTNFEQDSLQFKNNIENEVIVRMLKCKNCDELFYDLKTFDLHFASAHKKLKKEPQSDTTCKICFKTFAKLQFLKLHVAAIHEKNLFECEVCGKKFSFERAKIRHVEVIHNNQRKYKCSHCQKVFGTSTQMKEHVNYYHSTKPLDKRTHYCKLKFFDKHFKII